MDELQGKTIGRYTILEALGHGGMADVYKAHDTRLERDIAIKFIRRGAFSPETLERMLKRFEREAKALARLSHPNIVKVYDYGEHKGSPYLVMEYLPGGTLKQKLLGEGKRFNWRDATRLLLPVAQALAYAHEEGIIHRDVKPANILLTKSGWPMLSDFGIAKILEGEKATHLTSTGMGVGTPEYMAPEQWQGKSVPQSDTYALGVVLYEMVTGRKPYSADTPGEVFAKQLTQPLPSPRQYAPDLPEAAVGVIGKALAKEPGERYASMGEFAQAMEDVEGGTHTLPESRAPFAVKAAPATVRPTASVNTPTPQPRDEGETYDPMAGRAATSGISLPKWGWGLIGAGILLALGLAFAGGRVAPALFSTRTPTTETSEVSKTSEVLTILTPAPSLTFTPTLTQTPARTSTPRETATPSISPTSQWGIGSTRVSEADGMVQVYVPAGDFLMGSTDKDPNADSDEKPQHTVYLDAYWIDRTEVTNAMYAQCVSAGACSAPKDRTSYSRDTYYGGSEYADYPVIYVDWYMAQVYCGWAGRRLPTEAECEKAARGTDGGIYPWGNQDANANLLNYNQNEGDTTRVGSYPEGASPYGALDMAGNVWEWVNDWYEGGYYGSSPRENPQGPSSGDYRLLRGGSWVDDEFNTPSADRHRREPSYYHYDLGFRCSSSP